MNPTEQEVALIEINKFLVEETRRLLVEVKRLKAQARNNSEQDGQMPVDPPDTDTVYTDHHCV